MLLVGGLLLGAMLTAPGAVRDAGPADPFGPTVPRVAIAHRGPTLGVRDPFAPDPHATARRSPPPTAAQAELRDPFAATREPLAQVQAPAPSPSPELRDPFGR